MLLISLLSLLASTSLAIPVARQKDTIKGKTLVFIGSHSNPYASALPTNTSNKGTIRVMDWNSVTGGTVMGVMGNVLNPSYVRARYIPEGDVVFVTAVQEYWYKDDVPGGAVSSWVMQNDYTITHVNTVKTDGRGPIHLSIMGDLTKNAQVATISYGEGNVSFFGVVPWMKTQNLSKNAPIPLSLYPMETVQDKSNIDPVGSKKQNGPHGNGIFPDPTGKYWLAVDLGLDRLLVYGQDHGLLSSVATPKASGPRHAIFHPRLPLVYTVHEISNQVCTWAWNSSTTGSNPFDNEMLSLIQCISSLPPGSTTASSAGAIKLHPAGTHLLISNRGHDSIQFIPLTKLGLLDYTNSRWGQTEKGPRDFEVTPDGNWVLVACRDGNKVMAYSLEVKPASSEGTSAEMGQELVPPVQKRQIEEEPRQDAADVGDLQATDTMAADWESFGNDTMEDVGDIVTEASDFSEEVTGEEGDIVAEETTDSQDSQQDTQDALIGMMDPDATNRITSLHSNTPYTAGATVAGVQGEVTQAMGFKTGDWPMLVLETPFPTSVKILTVQ